MCDAEEFKSYLSNLEEFVFDENKIVSIKWLSMTLQIQVSLAKQLLTTFANDEQFKDKLSTSWFVYGQSTDQQTKKVLIVPDNKLESVKVRFAKITSQHIFSIQKRVDNIDLNTLYLAAQTNGVPVDALASSLSNIKCNGVKLVESRRNNVMPEPNKPITKSANLNPVFKPVSKSPQKNSVSPKKNEASPQKNDTLGNMFSKKEQSNKTNNKKEVEPEQKKEEDGNAKKVSVENKKQSTSPAKKSASVGKKKIPEKGASSISSFFSKNPLPVQKKKDDTVNKEEIKPVAKKNKEESEDDGWMMDVEEPDENKKPAEPIENVKNKKQTKEKSKRQKKAVKETINNKKNEKKAQPKRKRIQVQSESSDSEDDQEVLDHARSPSPPPPSPPKVNLSDDEDDVIPPTPEPAQNGRKRKRKLVSKTMMDESGFLRTVKEFETVSCSDSDGESQSNSESQVKQESKKLKVAESSVSKKSPVKQTKKSGQTISPHNSKQTSILGFFSKKS